MLEGFRLRLDPIIQDENLSGTAAAAESNIGTKDWAFTSNTLIGLYFVACKRQGAKVDEHRARNEASWKAPSSLLPLLRTPCVPWLQAEKLSHNIISVTARHPGSPLFIGSSTE